MPRPVLVLAAVLLMLLTLAPSALGGDAAQARWTLKVVDTAAQDTGRVRTFKLAFTH